MLELSVASVKSDIKSFNQLSDDHVQQSIDEAKAKADVDSIPSDQPVYRLAVIDYARHLLLVDIFSNYNVVSANDLGQSETVANPNTYDDHYLKAYQSIAESVGDTGSGGTFTAYDGEHYKNVF